MNTAKAVSSLHLHRAGSPEWKAARRGGLGASEVPAILGLGKYQSPLDVWLEKKGLAEDRGDTPQSRVGRYAEGAIAAQYADEQGFILINVHSLVHPVLPFLFASADRMAVSDVVDGGGRDHWLHAVECKNRGGWPQGWGESGTDQVPDEVAVQAHVQMAVYDLPRVDVAALISGNDFRVYPLHRNREIEGAILEGVEAWWTRHIIGDEQPELGGPNVHEYLAKKFAQKNKEILKFEASSPVNEKLLELASAQRSLKEAEEEKSALQAFLKNAIGEAYGLEAPAGRVTWGTNKDSEKVDWEAVARAVADDAGQKLGVASTELIAPHVSTFTTIKPGSRTFRFTPAGGE